MADMDKDDYEFVDVDGVDSESRGDLPDAVTATTKSSLKEITNNILIAAGAIVVIFIVYKCIVAIFFHKSNITSSAVMTVAPRPLMPVIVEPQIGLDTLQAAKADIQTKLNSLESTLESNASDISNVNSQIETINGNINELTTKIDGLNQNVSILMTKIAQQSSQIINLTAHKQAAHKVYRRQARQVLPIYYIQALIPGRAWLLSNNGITITVREGSRIPGYGVVKLIDPSQGRVLTGSGRIIGLSKQDA